MLVSLGDTFPTPSPSLYASLNPIYTCSKQQYFEIKVIKINFYFSFLKGEYVYWSAVEIPGNPITIVNTRILMGVRDKYEFEGHACRATAYALMLYLDHNEFEDSKPIMAWLHTQHNALVGWDSSQDSLLVFKVGTVVIFMCILYIKYHYYWKINCKR